MNSMITRFFYVALVFVLVVGLSSLSYGQVNVTVKLNTASHADTLQPYHFVQIRGAVNGQTGAILPDGKTIDWGSASELVLDNEGGDYWGVTFQMNTGDTLRYKFWTGYDSETGTSHNTGWENDLVAANGLSGGDRGFIAGSSDTTLDLQFYNATGQTQDQYWKPFEVKEDSVAVFFKVNMGGVTESGRFDPSTNGPVGVRGDGTTSGGALDWGTTKVLLSRETNSVNNGSFWSGVAYIPESAITLGSEQTYKFFIENAGQIDWEGSVNPDHPDGNRTYLYTASLVATGDTTLHWVYFNNEEPTGQQPVASNITFRVSTEALEGIGLFDQGAGDVGDQIKVIGAKGWGVPNDFIDMNFQPILQEWTAVEPFNRIPGEAINYKYYIVWDSSRVDPNSENYIPQLDLASGWEEPAVTGGGNRVHVYENAAEQTPEGDFGFDRQFFSSVPPNGVIDNDIAITFHIDMSNAANPDSNQKFSDNLFDPNTDTVWVQFDGELLGVTQGYPVGGEAARFLMLEDPDQDMVYSGTFNFAGPVWYQIGYVITYLKPDGTAIQNGGGFDRGRRYYQYVHPLQVNSDLSTVWPSSYDLAVLNWKEGPPAAPLTVEEPPNLTQPVSIDDDDKNIARKFELSQNYPNPFNPETTIRYQLAQVADVQINIYNVAGQLVKTLVNKKQNAGDHTVVWNGTNNNGGAVASGIYFMKMKAGDFVKVRKMTLLR